MDWTVLFVDCMAFNGKQISKKLRHAAYEISAYLLNFKMILREKCLNTEFFSGLYFPAFGLITERYGVSLPIQSECGENTDQKKLRIWTLFKHCDRLKEVSFLRIYKQTSILPIGPPCSLGR